VDGGALNCLAELPSFTSEMVRLFRDFCEAGLEAPNCVIGDATEGRGLGMGLDLTVRGAMFGREGVARSSTVFSSLGFGMGWPELVSISRGSAKETRAFFTSAAGVVGARFGVGGGRIDGWAMGWLVLRALLLPLYGVGVSVATGVLSLSSFLSSSGELVLRRLVCLVVRPSNAGRVWPRRRDFLAPLKDGVGDSGSVGWRSKSDLGICQTLSVSTFHMSITRHNYLSCCILFTGVEEGAIVWRQRLALSQRLSP